MIMAAAVALLLPCTVLAQTKKPATARPAGTRTTTTRTTTPQKPAEKRWGCYELNATFIAPTDSVIYYLENDENNAVMSLDCQTGAINTVIPGIKGVYEGARPLFRDLVATGGKLLLRVTKESKRGVYVWDGKSLSTSKRMGSALEIACYNGKYVLVYAEPKDKDGYTQECFMLWDVEQMKSLIRYPLYDDSSGKTAYENLEHAVMDTAANFWYGTRAGVKRVARNGRITTYKFTGDYIETLREENAYGWDSDVKSTQMTLQGDYLYVAFHRRIYRMNVYEPGTWEEYAKVPPTQEGEFSQVAAYPDGSLLTYCDVNKDFATQYYPVGKFDAPVSLGRRPSLPTTGHFINMDKECWISLNYMEYDYLGNILVLTNSTSTRTNNMFNTGALWVINPQGVNGYKNVVGKVVEVNK